MFEVCISRLINEHGRKLPLCLGAQEATLLIFSLALRCIGIRRLRAENMRIEIK